MTSFSEIIRGLDWSWLLNLLLSVIPAIVCITIHELCHGLAALALGDRTAETQRRLSLNPLRHIEPIGLLMLVVFRVGWAKPVPVNMMNFRHPKQGMALTALAGPVSNFVLAALVLFIRGMLTGWLYPLSWGQKALELFDLTAYLSLSLGVFNLIPIPPMDGSKVLFSLLPDRAYLSILRYERYGMILIVVVMLTGVLSGPLRTVGGFLFEQFFNFAQWGFALTQAL